MSMVRVVSSHPIPVWHTHLDRARNHPRRTCCSSVSQGLSTPPRSRTLRPSPRPEPQCLCETGSDDPEAFHLLWTPRP